MSDDAPQIDLIEIGIKKLIAKAKRRGVVTVDELNEALPEGKMSSEQIEDIMSKINDMGVQIVETAHSEEYDRRRAAFEECITGLREAASSRWGVLTQEEINAAQLRHGLNAAQIAQVQERLARPPGAIIVAEKELVDGMPLPGAIPKRSYGERIGEDAGDDACQLAISLGEITQFGRQLEGAAQKLEIVNPNALLTLGDLAKSGETFDDLLWVAGMQSTVSAVAMKRMAGFVTDASLDLACGLRKLGEDATTFLRSWQAGHDYVQRGLDTRGYVRELRVGQQAWLRHSGKMPIGTEFPWTVTRESGSYALANSNLDDWHDWAECMAWYVGEVRALYADDWKVEGSWERREEFENGLSALLVRWFNPSPPPAFQTFDEKQANFAGTVHRRYPEIVSSASPGWTTISVFPDTARRIERLDVDYLTDDCPLPYSLETIGTLSLNRQGGDFTIPSSVLEIDEVVVNECSLDLPSSIKRVGRLQLYIVEPNWFQAEGVERYDAVDMTLADCSFPEGVLEIGTLQADCSDVAFPSSLQGIDDLTFKDTFFIPETDNDSSPSSLGWREGPTRIGSLTLGENVTTSLPRSLTTIGEVKLEAGARLRLFSTTKIEGDVDLADGATISRMEYD